MLCHLNYTCFSKIKLSLSQNCPSIHQWINEQNVTHTCNRLLLRTEKEKNSKTCYTIAKDSRENKELFFMGIEFIGFWFC